MVMVYRVVLFLGRGEILSKIGDLITKALKASETNSLRLIMMSRLRSGEFEPCIRAGFLFKGLKENGAAVMF